MPNKKLARAIRLTTAALAMGIAGQASAINFQAGDVDASIYGYVRLNMTYDLDENLGGPAQEGSFTRISDSDANGYFGASANQSRIGIRLKNPDGVKVNVEGDFYAGTFRLRHAYGEYNGVLAGQTWSNYTSFAGGTSVLDFNGVAGNAGLWHREAQVRYTTGNLSLSVENPRSRLANSVIRDSSPSFTARYESKMDGGAFAVAALTKQNTYDTGTDDDSTIAYTAFVTGKIALGESVTVQGAVNYSDGANRYLYQSNADDAYVANGSIENISGYGGNIGATLKLDGGSSINFVAGMTKVDWDDALADGVANGSEAETNRNILVNYQWVPVKSVKMGVELSNWYTEYVNGNDEDANRIMFAAQYNF
ncbi:DcaP family trimeric outer membrane transporter [Marinobacter salinexigens]|nr:DcaP family trimeric outer membrane transporter [Marinobacter salinexigens]